LLVYYEPQWSGQTAHVLSLARGLDRERYEVTVVLPQNLEGGAAAFERAGARVVPLPMGKLLWRPGAIARLARLAREQDVVHVHSQEAGLVGRTVAWLAGARAIVYTPQVIDIRRGRWHRLYRLVERALARVTDAVVSVNEADRRRLMKWGLPPHKVVTIPNGIDLARFEVATDVQGIRRALGLEAGRPLVMQVGRLSAQKDPLAFVEGAAQVVQACPEAKFVLVGDGPLRREVAARVEELGREGWVHLAGWQPEAFRLMAAADVVTLTSRWEGMPYALLEAMAWSRPVVATAVNGCPEVVADGVTGLLVPPGEPAAWARAVVRLLKDPARAAAMGRQGRGRVEEQFTLEGMVSRVGVVYERVAGWEGGGDGRGVNWWIGPASEGRNW
jgi:glycosyltransferase involved in cell wall biosynthesis